VHRAPPLPTRAAWSPAARATLFTPHLGTSPRAVGQIPVRAAGSDGRIVAIGSASRFPGAGNRVFHAPAGGSGFRRNSPAAFGGGGALLGGAGRTGVGRGGSGGQARGAVGGRSGSFGRAGSTSLGGG
jgi:hypothetical protein